MRASESRECHPRGSIWSAGVYLCAATWLVSFPIGMVIAALLLLDQSVKALAIPAVYFPVSTLTGRVFGHRCMYEWPSRNVLLVKKWVFPGVPIYRCEKIIKGVTVVSARRLAVIPGLYEVMIKLPDDKIIVARSVFHTDDFPESSSK